MSNTIARLGGSVFPTQLEVYALYGSWPHWKYSCGLTSTQSFTTNITDPNYYILAGGSLDIQNSVELSNGSYLVAYIFLSHDTIIN